MKILLGASDAWSMSHLFHRPSKPAYYIVDCQISAQLLRQTCFSLVINVRLKRHEIVSETCIDFCHTCKVLTSSMIWPFTMGFSSTFQIVQILVHSNFDLVSSVLAVEATEPISEPVTQMALEPINNHLILVQQKR